jgi:integrase
MGGRVMTSGDHHGLAADFAQRHRVHHIRMAGERFATGLAGARVPQARRGKAAALPYSTCCHTFRATGITTYMQNGGTLEHAQQIAAHESPRTTKLYDRTQDEISLDEVERIRI